MGVGRSTFLLCIFTKKGRIEGNNGELNQNGFMMSTRGQSTRVTRANAAPDRVPLSGNSNPGAPGRRTRILCPGVDLTNPLGVILRHLSNV